MKIKAIQIANELGISKATVSLALNGKPGVNEGTRKEVLACKKRLEQAAAKQKEFIEKLKLGEPEEEDSLEEKGMILVIKAIKGYNIIYNAEIDLWTDVLAVLEREARAKGYMTSVVYIDIRNDSIEDIILQSSSENINGVVLVATELSPEDIRQFEQIEKPMVIYDNESPNYSHYSVVPDNYCGVSNAIQYLFERKYHNIVYLANDKDIYNFKQRRKAFCDEMAERNINPYAEDRIVRIGKNIEEVYRNGLKYLETHNLPQAYIMENYQVSIGMMKALREMKIDVPRKVALIGVDVVPDYITYGCKLTVIRVPHTDRAVMTMLMLFKEMDKICPVKSRILTDCHLVEGDSVAGIIGK